MAKKPKIQIKLIDKKGQGVCHHGHKIGDTFDFDTQRGQLCPMMAHVSFPYVDILRYGGEIPVGKDKDRCKVCCPDSEVMNIFEIKRYE